MSVFLSYDLADHQFAEQISTALRDVGAEVVSINLQLSVGESGLKDGAGLDRVLENVDYVITVFSNSYIKDSWLQLELQALIIREARLKREFIVPIVVDDCVVPAWLKARMLDYRDPSERTNFDPITTKVCGTNQVFVVMNMTNEDVKSAYEGVIEPELKNRGYEVKNAFGLYGEGVITMQVLESISKSGLVVADLTGARPNCYLEAGYALALKKRIIFTVFKTDEIHFDLAQYRVVRWNTESDLRKELRVWLDAFGPLKLAAKT